MIIWLTGLSSSGKSTIAKEIAKHFEKVKIIDGDELRKTTSKELGYSREDREENMRRAIKLAKEYENQRYIVIVALMSPYKKVRNEARSQSKDFIEVFVKCSLKVCKERDVNKVYERFNRGEIKNVNGIDIPYEEPQNPEVIVETDKETVEESIQKILKKIELKYLTTKKLVIILGRGRCGTSMIAGILNKLGVDIRGKVNEDDIVLIKGTDIVEGYGERSFDRELDFLGHATKKAKEDNLEQSSLRFEKELKGIAKKRGNLQGWKSNDGFYLLPWLIKVYDKVYCIVCYRRDKEAQALSIREGLWRGKKEIEWCRNSIKENEENIEKHLKETEVLRLDVYFEDFFTDPENEVKKISTFLDISYNSEAKDFVKLNMKHF